MKVYLDDIRVPCYSSNGLNPEEWTLVKTAKEAFDLIMTGEVTEASFDHDLGSGQPDGYDLMKWIMEAVHKGELKSVPRFFFHTANPVGRDNMKAVARTIQRLLDKEIG